MGERRRRDADRGGARQVVIFFARRSRAGVWPFMIAQLIVLFLPVLFPRLVTVPAKWFGG
jgi:TRAP-type C4-dicarboxylate transport system permease large subunit